MVLLSSLLDGTKGIMMYSVSIFLRSVYLCVCTFLTVMPVTFQLKDTSGQLSLVLITRVVRVVERLSA